MRHAMIIGTAALLTMACKADQPTNPPPDQGGMEEDFEQAGEEMEDAAQQTGEGIEEGVEQADEEMEEAGAEMEEELDEAGDEDIE